MTESGAPPQADLDVLKDQGIAAQLITGCNAALRVFRIHEDQNAAVDQPISTVRSAVLELFERHDQVVLAFVEGVFYFGDARLRLSTAQQHIADQLAKEFSHRQVGGLRFDAAPSKEELVVCFRILSEAGKQASPSVDGIRRDMRDSDVGAIKVLSVLKPVTDDTTKAVKRTDRAAGVYRAALTNVAKALNASKPRRGGSGKGSGRRVSARTKRIVHELVDLSHRDAGVLLALAGLRGTGADNAEHSVAVAILAIALGKRLGIDKRVLADVGVAAIYHNEREGGEDGGLDGETRALRGAHRLIADGKANESTVRQAVITLQHNLDYAPAGGQFGERYDSDVHPLAQILRLAKDFDSLTRGTEGRDALDVPSAIAEMEEGAGQQYHPGLLDVFAEMIVGKVTEEVEAPDSEPVIELPPAEDLDAMLASFIDGGDIQEPAEPKPKPKAKKRKVKKVRGGGKTLGALKLKKIAKPRADN